MPNRTENITQAWLSALSVRYPPLLLHSHKVADIAVTLAMALGWQHAAVADLRTAALLHDIGKIALPDTIILKQGSLTPAECRIMQQHPHLGYQLLVPMSVRHPALLVAYGHHERWDGSGYPRGLRGEDIPESARIVALADVWSALREHRPYRTPVPYDEALNIIRSGSGTLFDPYLAAVFITRPPRT